MELKSLVPEYLNFCKQNKRLDDHTIKAYRTDLYQFMERFSNTEITEISGCKLEPFIASLHDSFKPKTVKRKIASIKAFFHYLEYKDVIRQNPFSRLNIRFREPITLPKIIPLSSVEKILKAAYAEKAEGSTPRKRENALRDIALFEMLFATGMRISELCKLSPDSVNLSDHTVLIHGKGAKQRMIQIENPHTLAALHDYYEKYRDAIIKCNHFFINRNGSKLSDQSARRIIRKYTKSASIAQHITPHMFRHTFASSLLDAGVDIRYIQELLGHSSISVTQIYTHVSMSKQKEILATKHPRNLFRV